MMVYSTRIYVRLEAQRMKDIQHILLCETISKSKIFRYNGIVSAISCQR